MSTGLPTHSMLGKRMKSLINILKLLLLAAILLPVIHFLNVFADKYNLTAKQLGLIAFAMVQPVLLLYILYGYLKDRKQDLKNSGKVWLIILAGYEVMCIGVLLVAGNKFGFLPTFPFAGTLTMGVGMLLLFAGSIYGYQSNLKE